MSKPKKPRQVGNMNVSIDISATSGREVEKVLIAMTNGMPSGLLLDSTASCHIIMDKGWFYKIQDIENQYIFVRGYNHLTVISIGFIVFQTYVVNGMNDVQFDNMLYVSGLGTNLISFGLLQEAGAILSGSPYGISLACPHDCQSESPFAQ